MFSATRRRMALSGIFRFCVGRWFRRLSVALFLVGTSLVRIRIGNLLISHEQEFNAPPETIHKDPSTNTKTNSISSNVSFQSSSMADNNTKDNAPPLPPESIGACENLKWWTRNPVEDEHRNHPIWVASFPGSGAEMVRQLVQGLTGNLEAWSVYDKDNGIRNTTCLQANAATCKTHWPVLQFKPVIFPNNNSHTHDNNTTLNYHSRAIVLLRNPSKAYPSRMFHQWERNNKVGYHVREANEKAWNRWIRHEFQKQQSHYRDFVTTWAQLARQHKVALVVPYEELTDPARGPSWANRIISVLHEAGTRHVLGDASVSCLWKDAIVDRPRRKRAPHTYQPGFRKEQHQELIALLADLIAGIDADNKNGMDRNESIPGELTSILQSYHRVVKGNESVRILS